MKNIFFTSIILAALTSCTTVVKTFKNQLPETEIAILASDGPIISHFDNRNVKEIHDGTIWHRSKLMMTPGVHTVGFLNYSGGLSFDAVAGHSYLVHNQNVGEYGLGTSYVWIVDTATGEKVAGQKPLPEFIK